MSVAKHSKPQCNLLAVSVHKCVESIEIVSARLRDKLGVVESEKHCAILSGRTVNVGVEVVVAQLLIFGVESVDELVACVSHVRSMAENRGKVKGLCALCRLSQLVKDFRFTHKHTVDLGCFVSLAFA